VYQHPAPDFTVEAALPDGSIGEINLADYRGRYVVLFFYPLDFTFVCPTKIYAFADRIAEFEQRDCAVFGVSVDSVHAHLAWRRMPRNEGGVGAIPFLLLSDLDKRIARAYGVLLDAAQFHEQYGEVCPANWQRGTPSMTATLEGLKQFVERQADQHEYVYA
jgi:peroxiredoxin 2/4